MKRIWFISSLCLLLVSCSKEEMMIEHEETLFEEVSMTQEPSQSVQREDEVHRLLQEGESRFGNLVDGLTLGSSFFEFAPDSTLGEVVFLEDSHELDDSVNYGRAVFQWGDGSEGTFLTLLYNWDSLDLLGYLSEESSVLPW